MQSHDVIDRNSAKSLGHKLAKDPDINTAVSDLLSQVGIPKRRRAERLADMIESADLSIVGRGLELSYRLDRSLVEQVDHSYSIVDLRAMLQFLPGIDESPIIDISPE